MPETPSPREFLIACLCAEWCDNCRKYRPGFLALAEEFPQSDFRWVDIEDEADHVGDIEVENFPTLLIQRGEDVLFYGPLLPHIDHLRRLVAVFLGQTPAESQAYATATPERTAWQEDTFNLRARLPEQD